MTFSHIICLIKTMNVLLVEMITFAINSFSFLKISILLATSNIILSKD